MVDHIPDQSEQPWKGEELVSVPQKEGHTQSTLSKSEDAAVTSIKRSDHYSHHQKKLLTSQNTTGVDRKKTTGGITGRKRSLPSSHTVSYRIPRPLLQYSSNEDQVTAPSRSSWSANDTPTANR